MEQLGPYELERELGRGGMGVVYVARDRRMGRRVALKVLGGARDDADGRATARFERETAAAARIQHPNVITVYAAGTDAGRPWLAMELIEGESLERVVARSGRLPAREAARLMAAVARGVEAAHAAGLLHRDLKPANVLVGRDGQPKVVDFGLVSDASATQRLTLTGEMLGTPAYMAPEQAAGERHAVDARTDVYGLGATLYHLLTGQAPFGGATLVNIVTAVLNRPPQRPRALAPDLDASLEELVLRCLAKSPEERPATAGELADALDSWLQGERPPARRRAPLLVGLAVVGLVGGAVGLAGLGRGESPADPVAPATEVSVAAGSSESTTESTTELVEATTESTTDPAAGAPDGPGPKPWPSEAVPILSRAWREALELRQAWRCAVEKPAKGLRMRGTVPPAPTPAGAPWMRLPYTGTGGPLEVSASLFLDVLETGATVALTLESDAQVVALVLTAERTRAGAKLVDRIVSRLVALDADGRAQASISGAAWRPDRLKITAGVPLSLRIDAAARRATAVVQGATFTLDLPVCEVAGDGVATLGLDRWFDAPRPDTEGRLRHAAIVVKRLEVQGAVPRAVKDSEARLGQAGRIAVQGILPVMQAPLRRALLDDAMPGLSSDLLDDRDVLLLLFSDAAQIESALESGELVRRLPDAAAGLPTSVVRRLWNGDGVGFMPDAIDDDAAPESLLVRASIFASTRSRSKLPLAEQYAAGRAYLTLGAFNRAVDTFSDVLRSPGAESLEGVEARLGWAYYRRLEFDSAVRLWRKSTSGVPEADAALFRALLAGLEEDDR